MYFRPLIIALSVTALLCIPERVTALSPTLIQVVCPEGTSIRRTPGNLFSAARIDLFVDLFDDIQRIMPCRESGLPSYRDFTRDELRRIADLMETEAYRIKAKTETQGALALLIERHLNGDVETRLGYRLRLHDAYYGIEGDATDPAIQNARYRAILPIIRDGYEAYSSEPIDHIRAQLQLAILSRKLRETGAIGWFERAELGERTLSDSKDYQQKDIDQNYYHRRLYDNVEAIRLCVYAPDDLEKALCEGAPDRLNNMPRWPHGIERLAQWAFRGPIDPDSTEEQERLRVRLENLRERDDEWAREEKTEIIAKLDAGPGYFRNKLLEDQAKMKAIQRERLQGSAFKELFDKYFSKNIKKSMLGQPPARYYCDLLSLMAFSKADCLMDKAPSWAEAHRRFPGVMSQLREERRQQVLTFAAFRVFQGEISNNAIVWARTQDDFDDVLAATLPNYFENAARRAGGNSAQCDLGEECHTPSRFEAAMRPLPDGEDATRYREIFNEVRKSRFESSILSLAYCDVEIALDSERIANCLTGEARERRVSLLRSQVDGFRKRYAEHRKARLELEARYYGGRLALKEMGEARAYEPTYDPAALEVLLPNAEALIEEARESTLEYRRKYAPLERYSKKKPE